MGTCFIVLLVRCLILLADLLLGFHFDCLVVTYCISLIVEFACSFNVITLTCLISLRLDYYL